MEKIKTNSAKDYINLRIPTQTLFSTWISRKIFGSKFLYHVKNDDILPDRVPLLPGLGQPVEQFFHWFQHHSLAFCYGDNVTIKMFTIQFNTLDRFYLIFELIFEMTKQEAAITATDPPKTWTFAFARNGNREVNFSIFWAIQNFGGF